MRVLVGDVGPRDGLQNEPAVLAPAVRAELSGLVLNPCGYASLEQAVAL